MCLFIDRQKTQLDLIGVKIQFFFTNFAENLIVGVDLQERSRLFRQDSNYSLEDWNEHTPEVKYVHFLQSNNYDDCTILTVI